MSRRVVAIDGPSGSGKSTAARRLADALGFSFLDSGAMYRALALKAGRLGVSGDDEAGLAGLLARTGIGLDGDRVFLDGADVSAEIRTPEVTRFVSVVAALAGVRALMVPKQREAHAGHDLVAEGRDIGSVVFRDAEVKFFLTASAGERARRRAAETGRDLATVLGEMRERDARDEGREHSPLVRAEDAVVVDTDGMTIEEVVRRLERTTRRILSI